MTKGKESLKYQCPECKSEKALAQPVQPEQEPEYWNVIDPAGNIVASETDAIRGWARIAGSYKPTVEGLLGFHDQGWRVLPKVAPPLPVQRQPLTDDDIAKGYYIDPFKPAIEAAHNIGAK